jgi:hypothetical protein
MDPEVLDGIVNAVLEPAADAGEVERDAAVLLRKYRKLCVEIGRGDSYHLSRIDAAIESIHRWAAPEAGAGGGNHG